MSEKRIPLDPFQQRFRELGLDRKELAERLGFVRSTGRPDASRAMRLLGLEAHWSRGRVQYHSHCSYDSAVKLSDALEMSYHEAGV